MNAITEGDFTELLGAPLAGALQRKKYTTLTAVQQAVLDPGLAGRDLRITSQTGSGKTIAIGFVLRSLVGEECIAVGGIARPRAIVIAPTRELAKQVEEELSWLYAPLHARVASVTGGASYRDERRAFSRNPAVIVGTPGRLLDHITRGGIDLTRVGAMVLDEADRMLDLGFREELEAILARAPEGHRTHLMSATFPRDVQTLANRVQDNPAHVEGTRLGVANVDIDHIIHLVDPRQHVDAIVNLLLAAPEAQTLIFARTRADVGELARELHGAGFPTDSLSGDMEQNARNRALEAFKRGALRVLVATDVAARGIDVQDISQVIHADPPTDPDSYTHRSGRTGRAGRKGMSSVLVVPAMQRRVEQLLRRAGVKFRYEPIPTADQLRRAAEERMIEELAGKREGLTEDFPPHVLSLAARLAATEDVALTLARLLVQARISGVMEPRNVRAITPISEPKRRGPERDDRSFGSSTSGPSHGAPPRAERREERRATRQDGSWVPFRVSWGQAQGADARRLLALMCRRGGIRGSEVGTIEIRRSFSVVEIASGVAESFREAAARPDSRDARVTIHEDRGTPTERPAPQESPRAASPQRVEMPRYGAGPKKRDAVDKRPREALAPGRPKREASPEPRPRHASPTPSPKVEAPARPNTHRIGGDKPPKRRKVISS